MGSVIGGECKLGEAPAYVVLGKTSYDQRWIDGDIESHIAGCGWARPKARPPELDAKKKQLNRPKPAIRELEAPAKPLPWWRQIVPLPRAAPAVVESPSPVQSFETKSISHEPDDDLLGE